MKWIKLMQKKISLFKLLFLVFFLFFWKNIALGFSIENQSDSNLYLNKKNSNNFIFLKKNECFSFLKSPKNFFQKEQKIIISNNNFIGFFYKNKFKIFYIVKSKDTLYSIAKNSGYNYYELSKFNSIKKPYKIIIGQKIWMGDVLINENEHNFTILNSDNTILNDFSYKFIFQTPLGIKNFLTNNIKEMKICFFCNKEYKKNNVYLHKKLFNFSNKWFWPVKSKNIQYIYNDISDDKKIEISGFKGQPVFAAASGEVVCVTNSFQKYGQLIIIRHNKNYLSIYAFNNSILVKEKDVVDEKQQIATMGLSSDTHLPGLYFAIRYLGESINPLNVLPKINVHF